MTAPFVLVLAMLSSSKAAPAPIVSDLRCEYAVAPICVEAEAPRLSWITQVGGRDWKQSAYQILVASQKEMLAGDKADLWDSGKVGSDASIQIPYAGKALKSREQCFWKVRVWDGAGKASGWSKPQTWEMGMLDASDWKGSEWIGVEASAQQKNPAPFLRKEFVAVGDIARARLYASGVGYAELHLNGKKVGGDVERDPGYTDFDKRLLYVAHDVTKSVKSGTNALGAVLGTGWYDVHDLATWNFDKAPWRGRPRLKLALVIDFKDGRTQTVVSDSTWKAATGPILSDGIYSGEVYDARAEIAGWDTVSYNALSWRGVSLMPAPKGKLTARVCPPVRITQTIKPIGMTEPKPGVFVVDFGQNFSGHARLKVKGAAGTKITMRYSERIAADGMIQRSEIDTYMTKTPPQSFQVDEYICKGKGTEEWEQRFSYSGFRYMEVTGFPGKPSLENFSGRFAHTDVAEAGQFECSDETVNKIQRATRAAYYSNAQSILTDCPQREKNGWTGDAQLACEAGLMNFQSETLYTKWLDDLADNQMPDGRVAVIVPTGGWGRGGTNPAWDSAYPIIVNDLYNYSGDTRLMAKHYEHMRRYVDYLSSNSPDGLVPFDSLGDWLPWSTETPSQLTSTIFLFVDAGIVSRAAGMLGMQADAEKYGELARTVRAAFVKKYLDPADYGKSSQAALSMSLFFGLVPEDQKAGVFAALVKNVEAQGHIDTGILGAKAILRVLSEGGRTDLAYHLVTRKEQPSWAWWIEQGATTLWEDWKGESSLNHIMFGDVSNWFYQWLAGIGLDLGAPAFKHILIRPQVVGDLTWVKGSHLSPYGMIASSWRKEGGRFSLDVVIPANTTATVSVPGHARSEGLSSVREEGGCTVFEVGSGSYSFTSAL